jgi:hypothetical protein
VAGCLGVQVEFHCRIVMQYGAKQGSCNGVVVYTSAQTEILVVQVPCADW